MITLHLLGGPLDGLEVKHDVPFPHTLQFPMMRSDALPAVLDRNPPSVDSDDAVAYVTVTYLFDPGRLTYVWPPLLRNRLG